MAKNMLLPLSHRSSKTEVRQSPIHGRGLFAKAAFVKDEIVMVKGGHIVDGKTLRTEITPNLGPVEIQIDDDLYVAPTDADEREGSMLYSNHSCDAKLGMRGEITFVAIRILRLVKSSPMTGAQLTIIRIRNNVTAVQRIAAAR